MADKPDPESHAVYSADTVVIIETIIEHDDGGEGFVPLFDRIDERERG